MRVLSRADVQKAMDMASCIEVNARAFAAVSASRATVPVKNHIPVEGQEEAVALFMPGYLPDEGALGAKIVSVFPGNRDKGLPTTIGVIMLVSAETGAPLAVMDGTWLTSLRTGAGTGVATKLMARDDSKVLTLVGAGGMGFHQVEAVLAVRDIERVQIWNRTAARAEELAVQVRGLGAARVEVVTDLPRAVASADVVVASTASATPVVLGEWVQPGTHVNLIGSHGAQMREGDDELLRRSSVRAVDQLNSAAYAGELRIPLDTGVVSLEQFVELGAIVAGLAPGRRYPEEITWFKSVGLAAQDMACAMAVLKRAEELNLGLATEL